MTAWLSALDVAILHACVAMRTPENASFFMGVTTLGSFWVVLIVTIILCLALLKRRAYASAATVAVAMSAAGVSILFLKQAVERARPPLAFQAYPLQDYSFPSGHAVGAAVIYGLCAYFLARRYPQRRIVVAAAASLAAALIGFSRIVLGVHYASDVLAGFALGGTILYAAILVLRAVKEA